MLERPYSHSSSFKMAVLFTILLGLAGTILGYFIYYFSHGHFVYSSEAAIKNDIRQFELWDEKGILIEALRRLQSAENNVYLLTDQRNKYLAGNIKAMPQKFDLLAEGTLLFETEQNRYVAARIHTFADGRKLLVGVNAQDVVDNYKFLKWLGLLCLVFMLIVIGISFLISNFVASRTSRIAQTARTIMQTGNLSQRLQVDSRWDDLSYMTHVLNEFLERNERQVEDIRRVSDNIAHDLRTPLSRLRNHLEILRSNHPEDMGQQETIEKLISEADQILNTFAALLRITSIESNQQRFFLSSVNLQHIVTDVIELYSPLIEERGITLHSHLNAVNLTGDRDLIFQVIANLVDNAVKFTPDQGNIHINVDQEANRAVLSVRDSGPGIAETEKDKIFQRFYRSESSRTTKGNGLGLSLVAAVVGHHHGQISVTNLNPGLEIKVTLPLEPTLN